MVYLICGATAMLIALVVRAVRNQSNAEQRAMRSLRVALTRGAALNRPQHHQIPIVSLD
jgi:hypothetical protein